MAKAHEDNEGPAAHAARERMAAASQPSHDTTVPPAAPAANAQPQAGEIPPHEHALIGSVRDQVRQAREKLAELEKVLAGIGERLGIS